MKSHPTRVRGLKFSCFFNKLPIARSHPTRVRGLKYHLLDSTMFRLVSHPTRVRGLKLKRCRIVWIRFPSHPTRVRGLKFFRALFVFDTQKVAPYTGAWIEIAWCRCNKIVNVVAPYTGAWIEICSWKDLSNLYWSHPTRVRGLKLGFQSQWARSRPVAPYTGAWIEISNWLNSIAIVKSSHPTRVRGLKWFILSAIVIKSCRTLHGCVDWNIP